MSNQIHIQILDTEYDTIFLNQAKNINQSRGIKDNTPAHKE